MRRVASVRTNVVDTVGAGDSHIGAIIAGLSKGMKVEDAVLLANHTAAAIVGTSGPVMDLEEFQKISEEWKMNKIKEFFADWSWKEKAWLAFVLIVQTAAWAIQKEACLC